jgi:hypothetical protein
MKKLLQSLIPTRAVSYDRAKERANSTRGDINSAKRDIAVEDIIDGTTQPEPAVIGPLKRAISAERIARVKLDEAQNARSEAASLHAVWEKMVFEFERLERNLAFAANRIQRGRDYQAKNEQYVFDYIGDESPSLRLTVTDAAIAAEQMRLAIVLIEKAEATLRKRFKEHVRAMLQFGEKNGVSKDVLASLPEI